MKKSVPIFIYVLLLSICPLHAQQTDLIFQKNINKVDIPFQYENGFIVIEVVFNGIFPLRFIFDTGAENTIITKREITDLLQIDYQKQFRIMGADLTTELVAYLIRGISLNIEKMTMLNRAILVLEEDYFRFDEFAGIDVQGILGADIFRRFIVEIDYKKRVITFWNPEYFAPPSGRHFEKLPLEIERGKPYLTTETRLANGKNIETKLLLDSGAALPLLLYTSTDPNMEIPEKVIPTNIGMGLGGFLLGYLGRVNQLKMGTHKFGELITSFQELAPGQDSIYFANNRNGILGNHVLQYFNLYIDYINNDLYLKSRKKWKNDYPYDKSGLVLIASGSDLNHFTVYQVINDSPAGEAKVLPGDRIIRINGLPAGFHDLESINRKLRKKEGKKIKLTVERNGERLKIEFRLRKLI